MATSYPDYVNGLLAAHPHKALTGTVQLVSSPAIVPVTVVTAYSEGLVLAFTGENIFVPFKAMIRFALDNY